jgi:hypothetical protein
MSYTPRNIAPVDPVYLSTFGKNSLGLAHKAIETPAPSSGTYAAANRAYFCPFYTSSGYSLARWFWQNGATVGTNYIQVGIYDENLNLFRASPRTLSAGTVNALQYANPGIHGTRVTQGNDSTDATVYTTASVTLRAGVLYLISVMNSAANAAVISSIDSATGGYPTFTSRSTVQFNGTGNRVSIWSAVPTQDWTGTLRINYGATQTAAGWGLTAHYHVDTATNDGIVQNATGTGSSTTPLATLAAFGSANNATFGAFGNGGGSALTASTGYIELADTSPATPAGTLAAAFRPDNDTTVDGTWGASTPWGACAVEIKSLGIGAVYVPPMRGWLAIHCNGTTATLFRNVTSNLLSTMYYMQSSLTEGLPAIATLATATAPALYVCGFTSRATV